MMFNRKKSHKSSTKNAENQAALAEIALKSIHDGVIMTDKDGIICFINPAAVTMTECGSVEKAIGLDYGLVARLQSKEGREYSEKDNPLIQAMQAGRPLEPMQALLIASQSGKAIPVSIAMLPEEGVSGHRVITFRNITKELEEEGEQTEFISTASHEMRTPVATIDGYLSLCLNPQTATIDERAHGYLSAAQAASKHLGQLFHDLLDVTKLDDGRIRPSFEPVEMIQFVKEITDDYIPRAKEAKITFNFGSSEPVVLGGSHRMEQVVYGFIDINFMREILDNLIENALKYTPENGSIYVNVRGDGDRILINVTDTGIGISADDLSHIFQKFYRVDNSDTREIGGTGLGLYITKQRVEAMGGRIWAESAFGEGSTFYVSLPRITSDEYEKRMIVVRNQQLQPQSIPSTETPNPGSISAIIPSQPLIPSQPQPLAQSPGLPQLETQPSPQISTLHSSQSQSTPQALPESQPAIPTPSQSQPTTPTLSQPQPSPQGSSELQPSPQISSWPQSQLQAPTSLKPQSQSQVEPSIPPKPQIHLHSSSPPTKTNQPPTPIQPNQSPTPTQPNPSLIPTQPNQPLKQIIPTTPPKANQPIIPTTSPKPSQQIIPTTPPQSAEPPIRTTTPTKSIQPVQNQINNNLNGDMK